MGVAIKPEFPRNPDIIVNNNFKKSTDDLAENLFRKILKIFIDMII